MGDRENLTGNGELDYSIPALRNRMGAEAHGQIIQWTSIWVVPVLERPLCHMEHNGMKMVRLRLARSTNTYGIIVKHINDSDLVKILATKFFGSGQEAFRYLNTVYDTPVRRQDLRELDRKWIDTNIISDVGIGEDSVINLAKLLTRMNGERPAVYRHDNDELTEKLLDCIADSSRKFHELAMTEYNALPGGRKFEVPAGQPNAGSRDFLSELRRTLSETVA